MLVAKARDKADEGSSEQLLEDHEHYILFGTIKEKLKGLISAKFIEPNKIIAAEKAVNNMNYVLDLTDKRQKAGENMANIEVKKPIFLLESDQEPVVRRAATTVPQSTIRSETLTHQVLQNKIPERHAIKSAIAKALIESGQLSTTDIELERYVDNYLEEAQKKELAKKSENVTRIGNSKTDSNDNTIQKANNQIVSARPDARSNVAANDFYLANRPTAPTPSPKKPPTFSSDLLSSSNPTTPSLRAISSTPTATQPRITTAVSNKVSKMCAQPVMDVEATLTDSDLKILMSKIDVLTDSEKENYLSYMEKLKVSDPERYKRLNAENQNEKSKNVESLSDILNKESERLASRPRPNSNKVYSPGDHIISDEEETANGITLLESDSDSDDSAILANSIANTQQQIANMRRDFQPGNKIPVIDSVRSTVAAAKTKTVSNRIDVAGQNATAATLPPVHYQQQTQPQFLNRPFLQQQQPALPHPPAFQHQPPFPPPFQQQRVQQAQNFQQPPPPFSQPPHFQHQPQLAFQQQQYQFPPFHAGTTLFYGQPPPPPQQNYYHPGH